MKFLIAFTAVAAVAFAVPVQRNFITPGLGSPTPIVDENGSPVVGIGPANIAFSPVFIGPGVSDLTPVEVNPNPIIIPQPIPIVDPAPIIAPPAPVAADRGPLVQIIVNVQSPESVVAPVIPCPADDAVIEDVHIPGPVNVVDNVVVDPVQVETPIIPAPVVVLPDILN